MNETTAAALIKARRTALCLTQAQLAERIHVTAKAVSKWERGAGMPDASLVPELSRVLGIGSDALLGRAPIPNRPDGGNMKRIQFFQCPSCGNILTALSPAELICCGHRLSPMAMKASDEAHRLTITDVEDEKLLTWTHPMEKAHHLTFLASIGYDCAHIVHLYPEGAQEQRIPRIPGAKYVCGCSEESGVLFVSRQESRR